MAPADRSAAAANASRRIGEREAVRDQRCRHLRHRGEERGGAFHIGGLAFAAPAMHGGRDDGGLLLREEHRELDRLPLARHHHQSAARPDLLETGGERAGRAGGIHHHVVFLAEAGARADPLGRFALPVVPGGDVDRAAPVASHCRRAQPDAARADHRHRVGWLHAGPAESVYRTRNRLDEACVGRGEAIRQRQHVARVDEHAVGHAAVRPDPVDAGGAGAALLRLTGTAAVTLLARHQRPHRDRTAVSQPATDFMSQRERQRAPLHHLEIRAADAR